MTAKGLCKQLFDSLNEDQKTCFISFDEIHIKPGLHYQGKYILEYILE